MPIRWVQHASQVGSAWHQYAVHVWHVKYKKAPYCAAPPTGNVAPPTSNVAPPTGNVAPPTGNVAVHTHSGR